MELHFEDLAVTVRAGELDVPYGLSDEALFLSVRSHLAGLLCGGAEIFHFGPAPDNTADGQDELLENGIFYRIIAYEKNLGIDRESATDEILSAFSFLVENFEPRWATIFVEEGSAKREVTIELLYQEVF
ncbi:hypothetical protein NYQ10_15620 [Flavobacterium johnsoniae]|uniref:Uncharacterized protein n=2 Tax=Flavobacterium TaxID=237 RepID=A0A1M5VTZ0_FLAJO|nr:hypothetical protein [Flavobacterium johnsoniae]WJS93520.1 hypothetical protein NYQ10_15620 [Flavobacterium johnsoniae]SHH78677.1 hypothetical protein SAMN05444388_1203 [Flavobacterium johnsoniae]